MGAHRAHVHRLRNDPGNDKRSCLQFLLEKTRKVGREFENGEVEQGLVGGFIMFSSPEKLKSLCASRLT